MSMVWPVGGISPELRRGIIRAANGAGLTVEAWLEQTISRLLLRDPGAAASPASHTLASRTLAGALTGDDVPSLVAAIDRCLERIRPAEELPPAAEIGTEPGGAKVLAFVGRAGRDGAGLEA